jgi:hypothetical protein
MTAEQIRAFQTAHLNHLGQRLAVDGDQGPETEWALDFDTICAERQRVIRAAQAYIGLAEYPFGSNTDPRGIIQGFLTRCGAKAGDPWCAAFASHCLGTVRIPGALALVRHFPATTQPLAGDVYAYPTDAKGHGHCGVAIGLSPTLIMGIEGNCSNMVRCVLRPRSTPGLIFGRTCEDVSGTAPGVVPTVPAAPGGTR